MSSHYREWIVGAALVLCAGAAVGADLTGVEAAKARIAHMKALGGAAKALGDQLKSGAPDPVVVKAEAAKIDAAAKALPTWFPAGSGPSSGAENSCPAADLERSRRICRQTARPGPRRRQARRGGLRRRHGRRRAGHAGGRRRLQGMSRDL